MCPQAGMVLPETRVYAMRPYRMGASVLTTSLPSCSGCINLGFEAMVRLVASLALHAALA